MRTPTLLAAILSVVICQGAAVAQELQTQPVAADGERPAAPILLSALPVGTVFRITRPLYAEADDFGAYITYQGGHFVENNLEEDTLVLSQAHCSIYSHTKALYFGDDDKSELGIDGIIASGLNGLRGTFHAESSVDEYEGHYLDRDFNEVTMHDIRISLAAERSPIFTEIMCVTPVGQHATLDTVREAFGDALEIILPERE